MKGGSTSQSCYIESTNLERDEILGFCKGHSDLNQLLVRSRVNFGNAMKCGWRPLQSYTQIPSAREYRRNYPPGLLGPPYSSRNAVPLLALARFRPRRSSAFLSLRNLQRSSSWRLRYSC